MTLTAFLVWAAIIFALGLFFGVMWRDQMSKDNQSHRSLGKAVSSFIGPTSIVIAVGSVLMTTAFVIFNIDAAWARTMAYVGVCSSLVTAVCFWFDH